MSARHILGYVVLILVAIAAAGIFGIAIRLITQDTPSQPTARSNASHYLVERGDGLAVISQRTGVSEERLMDLNPSLDPLALVPGARIRLRPPTAAERARARRRREARPTHYVVKPGDSPSKIAGKTGVALDRLFALNRGLEGRNIAPGERLRIRR